MGRSLFLTIIAVIFIVVMSSCGGQQLGTDNNLEEETTVLPTDGDFTFVRYVEDKEQTTYRVLYSIVPDSKIVQTKLVQQMDSTDIVESNNFYVEKKDGIYGYLVVQESFPLDWSASDIEKYPTTKIMSLPPTKGDTWTQVLEQVGITVSYEITSVNETIKTPVKEFHNVIVTSFEEKDADGEVTKTGKSYFAPKFGWIKHETEDEYLQEVHELTEVNEE
ncbi:MULTISPECIES: hypothetical protein [Bacillus]|uniref:hypothetical protein n=1 Tax=Bacillus TaxID=1386 RepID=UPI000BB6B44E|nr:MULTISPECIES: hypothetical protein [Bacillus]